MLTQIRTRIGEKVNIEEQLLISLDNEISVSFHEIGSNRLFTKFFFLCNTVDLLESSNLPHGTS